MTTVAQVNPLKKPRIVYALGVCYILAAPINLAAALYMGGIEKWYSITYWILLFNVIPLLEKMTIVLMPVAGLSLFFQRKTSWLIAIVIPLGLLSRDIYMYLVENSSASPFRPLLINSGVLIVFYYFRFPYLDRRDAILRGVSKRFTIELPVNVENRSEGAVIRNISSTGCFLQFKSASDLPKVDETIRIHLDGEWIECQIVRLSELGCGARFRNLTRSQKQKIKNTQKSQPASAPRI